MATHDPFDKPLQPELPLGLGAAFLVMAMVCGLTPLEDRPVLVGFCAVAGVLLIGISIALRGRSAAAQDEVRHG